MTKQALSRKLAVIVAADMVGYSRLMEADEGGTLQRLKDLRRELIDPKIAEHQGRLVKTTGDGLLILFDSVTEAVQAAIEIQEAMVERNATVEPDQRLAFRMGINLGEIITEGDDIYGTGVNVAARLETLAEPGGICISYSVREQIRSLEGLGFDDLGEQIVKNLSRPVRSYAVRLPSAEGAAPAPEGRAQSEAPSSAAPLGVERGIPSVAVLPFANMSGDAEQEYFADGIAEDIITALSKISNLIVIARNSSFAYKGKTVDVQTIGRDLGVRYVLEGSVRKAGNRVRITAQLVEADTREHRWAARFDRDLSDIFALQDEITANVVTALHVRLVEGEQARVWQKATVNPAAWECLMQGLRHFRRFRREDNERARAMFRKALELDPNYASALVWLAWTYWTEARFLWTDSPGEAISRAGELARSASAINSDLADCCSLLGAISLSQKAFDEAVAYGERAVVIEPNGADSTALLAMTLNWCGRPAEASEFLKKAMRLSPIHSPWYLSVLGHAYRLDGRYDEAIAVYKKHIAMDPDQMAPHLGLTICYVHAGQGDAARVQAKEILRISPRFDMAKYAESLTYKDPEDTRRSVEALIEAGIPAAATGQSPAPRPSKRGNGASLGAPERP